VRWTSTAASKKQAPPQVNEANQEHRIAGERAGIRRSLPNQSLPTVGAARRDHDASADRPRHRRRLQPHRDRRTPISSRRRLSSPSPYSRSAAAAPTTRPSATPRSTRRYPTTSESWLTRSPTVRHGGQAVLLLDAYLRDHFTYDETATRPAVRSAARTLLDARWHRHAEQFATSFAVLARVLGIHAGRARLPHHRGEGRHLRPIDEISRPTITCWARSSSKASLGYRRPESQSGQVRPPVQQQQSTVTTEPQGEAASNSHAGRAIRSTDPRILDHGYVVLLRRAALASVDPPGRTRGRIRRVGRPNACRPLPASCRGSDPTHLGCLGRIHRPARRNWAWIYPPA